MQMHCLAISSFFTVLPPHIMPVHSCRIPSVAFSSPFYLLYFFSLSHQQYLPFPPCLDFLVPTPSDMHMSSLPPTSTHILPSCLFWLQCIPVHSWCHIVMWSPCADSTMLAMICVSLVYLCQKKGHPHVTAYTSVQTAAILFICLPLRYVFQ